MIGEGDLDPSEGQSQPLVGTLPLREKDPSEKPKDKEDKPITPFSPGSSDKTEETPTSPIGTRISTEYSPRHTSLRDPFSSFWLRNLGDVSDQSGRRHRWLIRKSKRRHSLELEVSGENDPRPYKYVLKGMYPCSPDKDFIAVI